MPSLTDFGVHRFDSVHQIMDEDRPKSITSAGGKFALTGMDEHPDVLNATYEYPGFVMSYGTGSRCSRRGFVRSGDPPAGRATNPKNGVFV